MVTLDLDKMLSGQIYGFVMVFSRIGCIMMMLPGIGESFVAPRLRLMLALSISFILFPLLAPQMPPMTDAVPTLVSRLGYEVIVGLFYGTLLRLIMVALETAGTIIAMQTGLSNATVFNPTQATQSPLPSAFLAMTATVLIFASGMDHMLLKSMTETYKIFPAGGELMPGDMTELISHTISQSFILGIELSMPFFVIGLLMFLALGLMQKVMPAVQLFMISMPVQIWGGLFLLSITTSAILSVWLRYLDKAVATFFAN